jgi:iron(III) transport system permease protein
MLLKNRTAWALFIFLIVLFALLLIWPVVRVVGGGFYVDGGFTAEYLLGVFRNPVYAEGLWNSFKLAVGSTLLATLFAVPPAWIANYYSFRGQRFFSALLLVPMVLPPFVGAIGFLQILGPYGALNALLGCAPIDWLGRSRYFSIIMLQALAFYPVIYLNVAAALANIDPAMDEAARNLGGGRATVLRRITLPLVMPGVFAGCTLVFIACFTELGTPLMLNYTRCAPVQVYDALKEISASPFPYALVTVVLICSVLLYSAGRLLFGRKGYAMQTKASVSARQIRLSGWRGMLAVLPFILVSAFALLPHIGVVLTSLAEPGSWYQSVLPLKFTGANYREALGHDMTVNAIRNSLIFSLLAVVLNLVIGVSAAWLITRSRLRLRGVIDTLAMVPLAVPGLVMAFGYISLSRYLTGLLSTSAMASWTTWLDVRENPAVFLVIAYAVRRLPYMVRAAVAGLQQTSLTLEEAAANLGASALKTLCRITTPLIMANLIAGLLLIFAFSMLEVSDSLMLAQKTEFYPITKTIFELFQLVGIGQYLAAALGVWAMLLLTVMIAGSSVLLGKKLGALFRA